MRGLWSLMVILTAAFGTVQVQAASSSSSSALEAVLEALPTCGKTCLVEGIETVGTCSATNVTCICTNEALNTEVEACVSSSCSVKHALTTKNVTKTACGATPRDRTKDVSYTGVAGGIIALIAIGLRLLARLPSMGGDFGLDDMFLLLTLLPMVPLSAFSVILAESGLGKDIWTVPFSKITHILYIYYFDESFYLASLSLIKLSILSFYLRIFPERRFRRIVYGVMFCCGAYGISFVLAVSLQCTPVHLAWKRWDGEQDYGHCVNVNSLGWTSAAFNIVLDVIVLSLPLPQILGLALSLRKKIHVLFMFLVGSFVTVISMLRLKWMIQFANSENVTWDYVPIGYWSTIEVHTGIICACLPAIRALLYKCFPKVMGKTSVQKSYGFSNGAIDTNTSIVQRVSKAETKDFIPLDDMDTPPGTAKTKGGVQVSARCYHS